MAHPREGWQGHGAPRKLTRRSFLGTAGGALAALGVLGSVPLLEACSSGLAGSGSVPLARPDNPVKWPVFSGNQAIASNLAPEQDATLQLYTWVAYINQDVVNSFAKKFKCKVQITTFNTMNEALSKLRAGLFYDQGWQYTVPYTIYTTGIAWRKDLVNEDPYTMKNPWSMLWQPKYKGRIAILDDYREGISLGLMKSGIYDLNTT